MRKLFLTLLLLLGLHLFVNAQARQTYSLNGTVADEKGATLPGAAVFLTNTKNGASTDARGRFSLKEIEPGTYQLVIKMIGFVPYATNVIVGANTPQINAVLKEDNIFLNAVTIKSTDPNREKYLKQFIKYFIGESANAAQCKILNPEVLNFHFDKTMGVLEASADKLLIIENDGLGYKLNYVLKDFKFDSKNVVFSYTGYPYFEELKGTASQQNKWDKNRKASYTGSMNHFFRSVYNHTSLAEGFYAYVTTDKAINTIKENTLPFISADSLFVLTDYNNLKVLRRAYNRHAAGDTTALYILYHGDKQVYEYKTTTIPKGINSSTGYSDIVRVTPGQEVKSPVTLTSTGLLSKLEPLTDTIFIDKNGVVTPRAGFLVSGHWTDQKIAELMPLDYHLDETPQLASTQAAANSPGLDNIISKLEKLSATAPTEKAYLHFNKPAYAVGDTIWFKGYITAGQYHQPSALSGILYVELIDSKDKIIKSLQLKSENGIATGDFAINDKFLPGDYHIRAYTTWMRNAGPDYFFNQTISIGNIKTSAVYITSNMDVSGKNSEGLINAKLAYTDKFGRAYDHKVVNYEVKADTVTLFKGTGITDDKGNLTVAFSDKAAGGQKRVNIINHIKLVNGVIIDKTIPVSLQKENIDIQFFPEGGQLVNDVRSKVAFKAIGINGLGADVKGVILDNDNKEVAYFEAQHAGMGIFALTPQAGKTYTAKVTLADNTTLTAKLPAAQEKGFVLAVNNTDSTKLTVRIATNELTLKEKQNTSFYLAGQSGETVYYTTLGKLDNPSFTASIPKNKFPTGIIQFTLFSSTNEPLNERVVFIDNDNGLLNLGLKTEKNIYAPKEKVVMALNAKDNTEKPVQGSFSLSVYNEDRMTANENAESTILSNILLTSDLKGYIEEPNYYFNEPSDQTKADLDILMLTQGYRRFEWKEIMAGHYPQMAYKPEKSLSISGLMTTSAGKPIVKGKLSVLALSAKTIIDTTTDAEGKFKLNDVEFADSTKLVIQARKANDGKNVNIALDNNRTIPVIYKSNIADAALDLAPPFLRMTANTGQPDKFVDKADTTNLKLSIEANTNVTGKELKTINIKGKPDIKNTPAFRSYPMEEYDLTGDQIKSFNTMNEALRHKITPYEGYGWVVLNGVTYDLRKGKNANPLNLIDPADVESVSYLISHVNHTWVVPDVVYVITKAYAGTDTIRLKSTNTILAENNAKKLKEVTIKEHKADKPDQSNLWGSIRPDATITGDKLQDYTNIANGIVANVAGLTASGGIVINPLKGVLPVVLNGAVAPQGKAIDDIINVNQVEDVKIYEGTAINMEYGLKGNGQIIMIRTKLFAGTDTASMANVKVNNVAANPGKKLKEVNIKSSKIDKPDRSNLYGSVRADATITGDKLQDYANITSGVVANVAGLMSKQGVVANAVVIPPVPLPIILNGFLVPGSDSKEGILVDEVVTVDQVEDVKIFQGSAIRSLYGLPPVADILSKVMVIRTKLFAGTDTTSLVNVKTNNIAANNGKKLKEVNIKSSKIDKPDKSNLWGSVKPEQIISGDRMREYAMTIQGLTANVSNVHYKDGYFLDMIAAQRPVDKTSLTKDDIVPNVGIPIPVLIDGNRVHPGDDIDALVSNDQIEDVKILQGNEFKELYGISYANPNDRIILITTKKFAGTETSAGDSIKKINLKDVTIKSRKNAGTELAPWQADVSRSANLNGPGHADQVFGTKDLQNCADFLGCLIAKIPGITSGGANYYFVRHSAQSISSPPPIQFMLDGQYVTVDALSSINVNDVESVEVLNSSSYLNVYGTSAPGGLFIITTKIISAPDNDAFASKSAPGVIYTKFNGFYKAKEFYVPKYTAANITTTDNRTAIYWNPNITTDEKGSLPIEFFNSDAKGTYRAVIEGIDNDGNIGRYVYRYRVQ